MSYTIKSESETAYVCKENVELKNPKKLKINKCSAEHEIEWKGKLVTATITGIKFQINDEAFILEYSNVDDIIMFLKLLK